MSTIKISQLGNLTTVQGNTIVPVVGNVAGTLITLRSNVAQLQTYILGTVATDLANLTASTTANAAVQSDAIAAVSAAWQANAATQLGQIEGANAAIVTANIAMTGYADAITTAWTANAITQLGQIEGANAAIVTANTALKGYVDAANTIQSNEITAVSNSVTGANAAIVTANTALKGYVDAANTIQSNEITAVSNSVTGANAAIVTANTALKGYVDAANTIQSNEITTISNSVTGANAAIVTANTALKGYVDAANTIQSNEITAVSNSVTGANAAIVTANTALKDYVDANNATQLTSINNITDGIATFGNIIPTIDATYDLGNVDLRWNDVYTNRLQLPLNVSVFPATINSVDYGILLGSNGGAALVTPSANINMFNDISITSTYANVLIHNANTAVTHAWQFTEDGDIILPNGSVLETNEDIPGMPSVSLESGVNGGVGITAISSNITAINGVFNQVTVNEYNAAIIIGDQIDGNVSYSWLFTTVANVGVISFPDSTNQQTAYTATLANVTPASATDTGIKGDIVYDASYIYICVETDQWIRAVRDAW